MAKRRPAKNISTAKKRTWKVVSKYIRLKHARNGIVKCVTCDTTARAFGGGVDCGHFIHGLTYELDEQTGKLSVLESNLWPQCSSCNMDSGRGPDYTLHMIDYYGRDHIEWLRSLRHKPIKVKPQAYFDLETELLDAIEDMERNTFNAG